MAGFFDVSVEAVELFSDVGFLCQEGHFLLLHGSDYHYKSVRRIGPFVLIRSLGYKLEIRYKSDRPEGPAAAVLIPVSLKRWKGPK